jgi:hypothetical protein
MGLHDLSAPQPRLILMFLKRFRRIAAIFRVVEKRSPILLVVEKFPRSPFFQNLRQHTEVLDRHCLVAKEIRGTVHIYEREVVLNRVKERLFSGAKSLAISA